LIGGNVFEHFERDHDIERTIIERQRSPRLELDVVRIVG